MRKKTVKIIKNAPFLKIIKNTGFVGTTKKHRNNSVSIFEVFGVLRKTTKFKKRVKKNTKNVKKYI